MARVRTYFRDNFRYSLYRPAPDGEVSALEDFLRRSRAGHCEYFATATVLLLRAAGVPARYAIGYSVQEWSPLERTWVVRARHAHSWALAWVDGAWRDVDTTPPGWGEIEGEQASLWQPLSDLFAWGGHTFDRWRYGERRGNVTSWLGWLLIPLTLILVWRLFFRRRQRRADAAPAGVEAARVADGNGFGVLRGRGSPGRARPGPAARRSRRRRGSIGCGTCPPSPSRGRSWITWSRCTTGTGLIRTASPTTSARDSVLKPKPGSRPPGGEKGPAARRRPASPGREATPPSSARPGRDDPACRCSLGLCCRLFAFA